MKENKRIILDFLSEKPGYRKEGAKRLLEIIKKQLELEVEVEECKEALREFNTDPKGYEKIQECKGLKINDSNIISQVKELEGYNIKSIWQLSNGEFRASYSKDKTEDSISSREYIDSCLESLKTTLKEETKINLPNDKPSSNKSIVVWTSDKHIGAKIESDSIYQDNYDESTLKDRLQEVINKVSYLRSREERFDNLIIADLGDALDGLNGNTVRGGHTLPQNMNNKEQFDSYIRLHKWFYDQLIGIDIANDITIINLINDNHSGDFAYFASKALESYISIKHPSVKYKTVEKFITHFIEGNHAFILSHGKDISDRNTGLPLNLNDKTENFINEYIDRNNLNGYYCHFIKGDLHQSSENYGKKFRYRNIPSMFGSSRWIQSNFGYSRPGATIEIISQFTNNVETHNIWFK